MTKILKTSVAIAILATIAASMSARRQVVEPSWAWQITEPLGLHQEATIDTLPDNYGQRAIPAEISSAYATTGNFGAEGKNMLWAETVPMSDFFFRDALDYWLPSLDKMKFYNTRIPMTLFSYNTAGGRENTQDRLTAEFSGNINRRAQVGALLDYIYSKGCYEHQAAKNMTWGLNGSYIGDRYEFQGFFNHYNLVNQENGGITEPLYITDPALVQGGVTSVDPKSIPVNLSNAFTRMAGQQFYMNHRYKVGYWHEETEGDSVISRTYIPVTSFIYTMNFKSSRHVFHDESASETAKFFDNTYLTDKFTDDRTKYWSLDNTIGISLLEGFHRYAKFGLAAFASYQIVRYDQTPDTLAHADVNEALTPFPANITGIAPNATEHNVSVGGQLTKQHGSILTYDATARFGISGRIAGDIELDGNLTTRIPLFGDTVSVNGHGSFHNTAAPYLAEHYISNHFIWENSFGKERNLRFGGTLDIAHTGSTITVDAANIQNHIYFGSDFLPKQHSGSVQLFSASLMQRLQAGILHWDNKVTYQTTSNQDVIPMPKVAIYSNLYIKFHVATLKVQMGVDCDYYTKYYAPAYQPATSTFASQSEIKVGNYPFMNVYANFKLSKTRFYVLYSHVNKGWFGSDYFSMPYYPLNPSRFQLGLSVDFAN